MSIAAVEWAYGQRVGTASAKAVLMALAYHADRNTNECYPTTALLEAETELSRRAIKLALKQLRDGGWITDTGQRRGKTGQIITYRMNMGKGATGAPLKSADTAPLGEAKGAKSDIKGCKIVHPSIDERSGNGHKVAAAAAREVSDKVCELAKACPVKSPNWMAAQSVVTVWLQRGADPELDIYPTVSRLTAGRQARGHDPPTSPNYFSKAVDEARAERMRMLNAPEPEHNRPSRQNGSTGASGNLPPYIAALRRGSG